MRHAPVAVGCMILFRHMIVIIPPNAAEMYACKRVFALRPLPYSEPHPTRKIADRLHIGHKYLPMCTLTRSIHGFAFTMIGRGPNIASSSSRGTYHTP